MADSPMTLSEHLSTQQASLSTEHARNVAGVVGRMGRVAAVIAQELAHAALRDRLGYMGGANASGDQVKKLDVWGHDTLVTDIRTALAEPNIPLLITDYEMESTGAELSPRTMVIAHCKRLAWRTGLTR